MNDAFGKFSRWASGVTGSAGAFVFAAVTIVIWAITGPIFHFSDTWQLVINTGTTIVTFLMVFLIQNAQNRDSRAIHLKLDELIRAKAGARNMMMDLEKLNDAQLDRLQKEFDRLCADTEGEQREEVEEAIEDIDQETRRRKATA